jgi:hypothetical protein
MKYLSFHCFLVTECNYYLLLNKKTQKNILGEEEKATQ